MKKRLKIFFLGFFILFGLGILASAVFAFYIIRDLPPLRLIETNKIAEATKIYDRTGEILLYEIHGDEKRVVIPYSEMPEIAKLATIAIEDANFYTHSAFDLKSIARAFIKNLFKGQIVQGGSTITQQLVKNAFLSPERTVARKIKELVLAIQLENRLKKDEILELYLNQIPYGSNAYGIEAASQTFFGKPAKDLSLPEAALLASLPRAPTYYSPWGQNKDALLSRQKKVLGKMYELGFISEKEKKQALNSKLKFAKPSYGGIKAPHFVMMVQDYLNKKYGEEFVRTNGLRVKTTLNWKLQQLAEKVVKKGADRNTKLYQGKNASLVAQDPKTGQILALVGSRDYFDIEQDGNFNVALQGLRQPGSAIKPFVYTAAFKKGYTPDTIVFDLKTEFDTTGNPEKSYKPGNFTNKFAGPMTFREALAQSVNVASVKVLYLTGINNALEIARNFGLNTLKDNNRYGLSLVLGGGEVRLIELVNAYSVFAQDGLKHKQSIILEIMNKNNVLEKYSDIKKRVIEPQYTRLINDILSDQEARAPLFGNSLLLPSFPEYQVAVKTGTTNDYRDAWSIGYTPSLVVGVWAGNNDNKPMVKKGSSIFAAVPMWKDFMEKALNKYPAEVFNKPEQIFVNKPVLKGQYIVNYKKDKEIYPQIHTSLFYINKNNPTGPEPKDPRKDSQFSNWENPVIEWAKSNIENFPKFNKVIPLGSFTYKTRIDLKSKAITVLINKPKNGGFFKKSLDIDAEINSNSNIKKIEFYFNGNLIDSKSDNLGKAFSYKNSFIIKDAQLQNLAKLTVYDENNNKLEKNIILFYGKKES